MKLDGKRVFLSGPMTGHRHNNAAAFATAHAIVKELGAGFVYNPATAWLSQRKEWEEVKRHEDYMLDCVHELTRRDFRGKPYYDLLVSLQDWHTSEGASHERDVAEHCGINVADLEALVMEAEL